MTHFIDIADFDKKELQQLLDVAQRLKKDNEKRLTDLKLGMIFEKPSMRTRVSFEAGMMELGGQALNLSAAEIGLGKRESIADIARVLSRYVDAIMIRSFAHDTVTEMAKYATVPVINGLTDLSHPCQAMADVLTMIEHSTAPLESLTLTYIGDGNNVCRSLIEIANKLAFNIVVCTPENYKPDSDQDYTWTSDPIQAVKEADFIYTDVWTSMGQEEETKERLAIFKPYQVNSQLMSAAKPTAKFMHCLPLHRDEEVTHDVAESSQSIIFDQAENRLHAQKAILCYVLGKDKS